MKFIFFLIFPSLLFFSGCFREYFDYWDREHTDPKFAVESPTNLTGTLIILPDKSELTRLISMLENAKKRIWIETYTWTEKETQEAVLRAKKRGIDIRVILEGNVFGTPRVNDPVINKLQSGGIDAKYTTDAFTFTHMKLWIVDDVGCVSTGNWSYTTFTKNREFTFCSEDQSLLQSLEEIFQSDFQHIRPIFRESGLDNRIGLAPLNLRNFLLKNIESAEKEIIVYNQTISDQIMIDALWQRKKQGVQVSLCQSIQSYTGADFHDMGIATSEKPYLHAKIFLIDDKNILLGSANLTSNALDNNREIMVKIADNTIFYQKIKSLYNIDCKKQP